MYVVITKISLNLYAIELHKYCSIHWCAILFLLFLKKFFTLSIWSNNISTHMTVPKCHRQDTNHNNIFILVFSQSPAHSGSKPEMNRFLWHMTFWMSLGAHFSATTLSGRETSCSREGVIQKQRESNEKIAQFGPTKIILRGKGDWTQSSHFKY